jgi:hypothetical protein
MSSRISSVLFYLFAFLTIILISCANTTKIKRENPPQDYLEKLNYLGRHRTGLVILKSEERFKADKIEVINDSLVCINSEIQTRNSISIKEVKKISFKDRFIGGFYGAFIGGFTGWLSYPHPYTILLVGVSCGITGYLIGSDLNFVFIDKKK